MINFEIELEDSIAYALAISKGWSPTIEDMSAEIVNDEYPIIANPITIELFLSDFSSTYITQYVLDYGRSKVISVIDSYHAKVEYQVGMGTFDELILAGDSVGIVTKAKELL